MPQQFETDTVANGPIFVAVGGNLPGPDGSSPLATCRAALAELARRGVAVAARSRWYESAPWPPSDQPWYVNAVIAVETALEPAPLMDVLHGVESAFGRRRGRRNEARVLDLDLLAYGMRIQSAPAWPVLPHPRLHERVFVLAPLVDLAPDWRHPVTGRTPAEMLAALPHPGAIRLLADGAAG